MKNKTAVEWLEFEINRRGPKEDNPPQWLKELYEQAKEMEKEIICTAYLDGIDDEYTTSEQYYNETFKSEQNGKVFICNAKWQAERMYSEEEVQNILIEYVKTNPTKPYRVVNWFEQFKKQQMTVIKVIELRAQYEVLSHIEEMFVPKSKHKVAKYVDKKMREILKELEIKKL